MDNLLGNVKINSVGSEYNIIIDDNLILDKVNKILKTIHCSNTEITKYVNPVNDDLVNELILRILVELFTNKISMEDNKPYIVNSTISGEKYRLSIIKLNLDNEIKYMYGLIMN